MNYEYYNPRKAALGAARELLTGAAKSAMSAGTLPEAELPDFIVEIPGDVKNGDIASNLAMAGARAFHRAPRQIAQAIVDRLDLTGSPFDRVEIAGPGFINLFLGQAWFTDVLRDFHFAGDSRPFAVLGAKLPLPGPGRADSLDDAAGTATARPSGKGDQNDR